ncbi:NAD(P)/FAD-dependent oxidoreductase [Micrococcoides hystricis]|uniref:NAD(P)/FAD-dependent oxidoreductase n=1 Tax=Micrococcoides hystricis TaxID=1572761 RepID=A0ABV6PBB0_9MICC
MTQPHVNPASILFIGGGLSAQTALKALRDGGYTGALAVIDPEGTPYDRPPLSKDYLLGTKSAEELALAAEGWHAEHDVDVITGTAEHVDFGHDEADPVTVTLTDGSTQQAEAVVFSAGGRARPLPIPGGEHAKVLRTKADADELRTLIQEAENSRLVIIGAGLIGAETASSALSLGATVALVDPLDPPLVPAVGQELAEKLHAMHATKGIDVYAGLTHEITEAEDGLVVHLADGTQLPADIVLAGIGIIPNTALAEEAGLEVENGIIVDEHQRTSHAQAFAIGDVCRKRNAVGELANRTEHWEAAMNDGANVAATLLGQDLPKHSAPWFWSDRHGVHVEGVGSMTAEGTTVLRESDDATIAFRLNEDNVLIGATAVDGGIAVRAARRLIDKGKQVDPAQLADPSVDLRKLAR